MSDILKATENPMYIKYLKWNYVVVFVKLILFILVGQKLKEFCKRKSIIFHSICEFKSLKQCHKSKCFFEMLHFKQSSSDVVFKGISI